MMPSPCDVCALSLRAFLITNQLDDDVDDGGCSTDTVTSIKGQHGLGKKNNFVEKWRLIGHVQFDEAALDKNSELHNYRTLRPYI